MSTHCMIGIENPDGTVDGIYCHFDGYLDGVGATLAAHYRDEAKVRALIALGNLSNVGAEIGQRHDFGKRCEEDVCTAYGRDRGEKDQKAKRYASAERFRSGASGGEYFYLWRNGAWEARNYRGEQLLLPA